MNWPMRPARSYLYVPGSEPTRIQKALASAADAVVLDLEDAVAPSQKIAARANVAGALRAWATFPRPGKTLWVRINALNSALAEDDIAAVAGPGLSGVRIPRVESPEEVRQVAAWLARVGTQIAIQCLIESALGVERAFEIACAHEAVASIGLGEADLRADLGVSDENGLLYARARIVTAARAARLPGPVQSVYPHIRDTAGLRLSTREGKSQGFLGRSLIHPAHIPIVHEIFTPSEAELAAARELLEGLERAEAAGRGAYVLEDGRFVDHAVAAQARQTLALAALREEETV